jgi:hypothetical protein
MPTSQRCDMRLKDPRKAPREQQPRQSQASPRAPLTRMKDVSNYGGHEGKATATTTAKAKAKVLGG